MLEAATAWSINAPADDFWKVAITLIGIALFSFAAAFYYLIRTRIIEDTPTSKIRSAAQGYVELKGQGQLLENETIKAPLTGKTCTWYCYKIERYQRSGKRSRWVTIEHGRSDRHFLLTDETGQVIIDPEGAEVTTVISKVWYGRSRHPDGRHRTRSKWFALGLRRYRYTENRLHPGEVLYALGLFMTRGGDHTELDVRTDMRELLREWKRETDVLLKRFDTNQDGEIGIKEWEHVRAQAYDEVMKQHAELRRTPLVHYMGKTGDLRRPYLLSAVAENRLAKKLSLYFKLGIAGFFLAGIPVVWLIGQRLGQ